MMGTNPVYFYYPNLIGYGRIIFLFIAGYCVTLEEPFYAVCFYMTSMGLDAIDGTVARYCNQSSSFGAQLDMLTDRMTTTCLYGVLIKMYPLYWYYYLIFIMLDIVSHWLHMMSKLEAGNRSHKTAKYAFLKLYYEQKYFMLLLCIGQELYLIIYFIMPYISYENQKLLEYGSVINWLLLILFGLKQYANILQMMEAGKYYANKDIQMTNDKQSDSVSFNGTN